MDSNQPEIVQAFKAMGATVQHLHMVGGGCPDILVGFGGVNYAVEIKDGEKVPSAQKLTPSEAEWHAAWKGQVVIVNSVQTAMDLLGIQAKDKRYEV